MDADAPEPVGQAGLDNAGRVYKASAFTRLLGLELLTLEHGLCRSRLPVGRELLNQNGTVHGGVFGVVADHTAGMAASTVVEAAERVVTAEYKVNILRPGDCIELHTEGAVVKAGRRLVYVEASVEGVPKNGPGAARILLCRASLTFAVVPMAGRDGK